LKSSYNAAMSVWLAWTKCYGWGVHMVNKKLL